MLDMSDLWWELFLCIEYEKEKRCLPSSQKMQMITTSPQKKIAAERIVGLERLRAENLDVIRKRVP